MVRSWRVLKDEKAEAYPLRYVAGFFFFRGEVQLWSSQTAVASHLVRGP
jgi:hypothetical protein